LDEVPDRMLNGATESTLQTLLLAGFAFCALERTVADIV
jgi:hypothetical protein